MNFKKIFSLIVIFILLGFYPSFAITFQEVLNCAKSRNNELLAAKNDLESAEWEYKQAYTAFLPNISASLSLGEGYFGATAEAVKSYSLGLSLNQPLFSGMENFYKLKSSYINYEYYKANFSNSEANVYYNVRVAFLDLLFTKEKVSLLKKILEQRRENARLIRLRYESGKEDKGNLMKTEADALEAEYNLSCAERDFQLAKLKLSQLIDENIENAEENFKGIDLKEVDFEELVDNSPLYIMAKCKLELAETSKMATVSGFLPDVSIRASWSKSDDVWPPEGESKSWSLNFSYPFFTGGSNFLNPIIYNFKLEKAKQDFEKSKKDIRYSIEEAFRTFKNSLEFLNVQEKSLLAAEERAKIARAKYLNGLLIYDEWNRIENDYINAQMAFLSSHKNVLLSEAAWYKSFGGYKK